MTDTRVEDRLAAARRLLERAGLRCDVSVAGMDGEIAAVRGDSDVRNQLARLAPEIRLLGFRYVALEPHEANPDDEDS